MIGSLRGTETRFTIATVALGFAIAMLTTPAPAASAVADPRVWPWRVEQPAQWQFDVTLDGQPVGQHRFSLTPAPGHPESWRIDSEAHYDLIILGIHVYTYQHQAQEQWRDGCLVGLTSSTNDDGKQSAVAATSPGSGAGRPEPLHIDVSGASRRDPEDIEGCVMSFAYWTPAVLRQTRLLNPQNGHLENVAATRLADGTVQVHGAMVNAENWEIRTPKVRIGLWYTSAGDWVGLDATVRGNHTLRYRIP